MTAPVPEATQWPIKEIALAIADRAEELGLVWRLVPATVAEEGDGGVMRVVLDGDSEPIDAVTMIGRVPLAARVFVILSPPAGTHIVGFQGFDFPAAAAGEQIGRTRLIVNPADFPRTSSTTAAVTALNFDVVANGVYELRLRASVNGTDAATGVKVAWSIPSGVMERYALSAVPGTASQFAVDQVGLARRSFGTENTSASISLTGFVAYEEDNLLIVGDTGGTVSLLFARVNAGTATFRANSYLTLQRYR
jgi:hypothetical protein